MSIRNLEKIFKPRSIVVAGGDVQPSRPASTVLRHLVQSGFRGRLFVTGTEGSWPGEVQEYPALSGLPKVPDLAVICGEPSAVPDRVRECGALGIPGLLVLSSGFSETGDEGAALECRMREEARRFDGLRIIGPNSLGLMTPGRRLNASLVPRTPRKGRVAFVTQSAPLGRAVLDRALEENLGFSHFVSTGNMIDVDFGDLIDYFASDPDTQALILYAESVTEARKFVSAARAFTRTKPIVAYKAGRFAETARASASHTGMLVGEDAVYDAAFERAGIVRVLHSEDLFHCAELLAGWRLPHGNRLAIVTNGGAPGLMAADALLARGGKLSVLTPETAEMLGNLSPSRRSPGNPLDILEDASPSVFAQATEIVLIDPEVDAVLVILTPHLSTDAQGTAEALAKVAGKYPKPVLCSCMGGRSIRKGLDILSRANIPTYTTPEQAVEAFLHLAAYASNRAILHETPREFSLALDLEHEANRKRFDTVFARFEGALPETVSKEILEAYGISVAKPRLARTAEEAVALARAIGGPVVLKIHSIDIPHKTEVGGVLLDLRDDREVHEAFRTVVSRARQARPEATVEGATVQPMVSSPYGFELMMGSRKDPTFGPAIMVGMGGVATEVFGDRSVGLPPLNERLARRMLESLRSWPLLLGYRGRPRAQIDRLIEVLMRFSYLVADFPQIQSFDVNPMLVTPDDVVALDARVILDLLVGQRPEKPFSHLAIRPYPAQWIRQVSLRDETSVVLRPIRPEDEPRWLDLLASCTGETLFQRFQYVFKRTHEMATRFCFIDYEREMAVVAEVQVGGEPKLVGVGRLVADPDHQDAEYSVLVTDDWQGKGLGGALTDYCLNIAETWGIRRITATTTPDNTRIIEILRERGFRLWHGWRRKLVLAAKEIVQ